MDQLNIADSPTNLHLGFSMGDTIDIETEEILVGAFFPGNCKIHTSSHPFFVPLIFLHPLSHMVA